MAAEAGAGVELSSCCWLLAVGADETLDEVPDVAGLGQPALGQLIRQLCLGQTLVCLAGLLLGLLGFLALDALGLAGLRLFSRFDFLDLLARSLLDLVGLFLRCLLGLLGLLDGQVGDCAGLVL